MTFCMLPLKGHLRKGGISRGTDTPERKISNTMFEDLSRRSERKENIWNELFVCSNRTVFEINALNKGHCTPDIEGCSCKFPSLDAFTQPPNALKLALGNKKKRYFPID